MYTQKQSSFETLKEIGQCLLFVLLCVGAVYFLTCEEGTNSTQLGAALAIWAYGLGMHIAATAKGAGETLVTEENLSHENI